MNKNSQAALIPLLAMLAPLAPVTDAPIVLELHLQIASVYAASNGEESYNATHPSADLSLLEPLSPSGPDPGVPETHVRVFDFHLFRP